MQHRDARMQPREGLHGPMLGQCGADGTGRHVDNVVQADEGTVGGEALGVQSAEDPV